MHSPLEIALAYIEIGKHKVNLSYFKIILLGMFAGIFIALAGIGASVAPVSISNPSIAKLVGSLVFPAGLAMVIIAGGELFTGNNLIIIAVLEKQITVRKMLANWFFVYIGNLLGSILVAALVVYGHTPDLFDGLLAQKMVELGAYRCNMDFTNALIRGILCNILVCIATWMSFATKSVSGKLITIYGPVMLFVLCGFEHSVADMYFTFAAYFASMEYQITAEGVTLLNIFMHCLLPVTIGNVIGGAGIVGCGYWLGYIRHTPFHASTDKEEQDEIDIAEEY